MCNFLSGVVTIETHPKILCADLLHHERTVELLGLKPETYREWEWTKDDDGASLDVRAVPGENPNVLKPAILAKFATRRECLTDCINQVAKIKGSSLDLSGTGVKELPALPNVEYLDLSGTGVGPLSDDLERKAVR